MLLHFLNMLRALRKHHTQELQSLLLRDVFTPRREANGVTHGDIGAHFHLVNAHALAHMRAATPHIRLYDITNRELILKLKRKYDVQQ